MASLEQRRAADALAKVQALAGEPDDLRKRYRAYADRLGPTIVMNGLGQALAVERAAAGANPLKPDELAHKRLSDAVAAWLCRGDDGVYPNQPDLLEALMVGDEASYLRAQAEALAWLTWHKKFCRATLPSPLSEADQET